MKRMMLILLAGLVMAPSAAWAKTRAETCVVPHFVRNGGNELRSAVIIFTNADPRHTATIERFTIRNLFGDVVHDSGPAIGVPLPLNTDLSPPLDVTEVPPGATYYLHTRFVWGLDSIPGPGGNGQGFTMAATVEWSKKGDSDLFKISVRPRSRVRVQLSDGSFREREETSSNDSLCFEVKKSKDDD
jgi:hypothetical protein